MASKMIAFIIIAALIARAAAEPPVMIDERHLRPSEAQQISANGWQDSVPGLPGRDYPNLTTIPRTSFSCAGKTPGGYYADVETRCQVFHVCNTQGDKSSFLCPSGSIFNQRHFVCDWWYDFECEQAPELYSLNKGLDDNNSEDKSESVSTSLSGRPSVEDERRYEDSSASVHDNPPLQYNSLAGSGGDLSLASSGYANNIRDEANSIYEDYTSGKIPDVSVTASPSTARPSSTSPTSVHHHSASTASGVSSSTDNYSGSHRKEPTYDRTEAAGRLNGLSAEQTSTPRYQARNYEDNRQGPTYRRRPSQGRDIVPRGFSKSRAEEQLNRNDQGAGPFVNDGLSIDELERIQNNPLSRENNNYIDNNNYNSEASNNVNSNYNNNFNNINKNNNFNNNNNNNNNFNNNNKINKNNHNNNFNNNNNNFNNNNNHFNNNNNNFNNNNNIHKKNNNNNFNNNNNINNNNNNINNNNNNINNNKNNHQNQYQNSNRGPLPQENNNYINSNNNNYNNNNYNNNNNFNNNQQTNNNINSNYQATTNSNNNHQTKNNFNDSQNNNDYKADYQSNNNANNNRVDKNFYSRNTINSNEQQTPNNNISHENNQRKTETTESILTKNFVFPESHYEHNLETPTEDPPSFFSSFSEDEVDRERQREVDSVDLKKQRPSARHFNDDSPTPSFIIREESSNISPVWRDDLSTSSSDAEKPPYPTVGSSLAKPEEATTPIIAHRQRSREYLGRRPQGGLPGGSGNGVPGANRVLAASADIAGKSAEDASANKLPASGEGSTWDGNEEYNSGSRGYEGGNKSSNGVDRNGQYWINKGQWNEGRY